MATDLKHWVGIAWFIGVLMYGGQGALAATLLVDDDKVQCPTATFTSIQAAVTAAAAGDTINVCPGNYSAVTIGQANLTLNGGFLPAPPLPPFLPPFLLPFLLPFLQPANLPAFDFFSCLLPFLNSLDDPLQHSVVKGASNTSAFLVTADNTTISNFTIQGS